MFELQKFPDGAKRLKSSMTIIWKEILKNMNYKEKDTKSILAYLETVGGESSVDEIIKQSGAEKLRVYPILFELEQRGVVRRTKTTMWGAIDRVKLI